MIRNLLLLTTALICLSCSKHIEDRLIGEWRLDAAYKKDLFGRDYFKTGFENGIFTFYESGTAVYRSQTDTLSGYWRSDYYFTQSYDPSTGVDETKRLKYLDIYLEGFTRGKILNWQFDEFNFRNNWKTIRAIEYSLGRDRYYEFVKP
jgi:hypothetical protein